MRGNGNAGIQTIPGIFIDGNAGEISLVENLQRQDITCIEEAEALKRLMDEYAPGIMTPQNAKSQDPQHTLPQK